MFKLNNFPWSASQFLDIYTNSGHHFCEPSHINHFLIGIILAHFTRFGRNIYAMGGNNPAALLLVFIALQELLTSERRIRLPERSCGRCGLKPNPRPELGAIINQGE